MCSQVWDGFLDGLDCRHQYCIAGTGLMKIDCRGWFNEDGFAGTGQALQGLVLQG